jgi:hypothetical protein
LQSSFFLSIDILLVHKIKDFPFKSLLPFANFDLFGLKKLMTIVVPQAAVPQRYFGKMELLLLGRKQLSAIRWPLQLS